METTLQVSGQSGWEAAASNSAILDKEDFLPPDLIGHVSAFLHAADRFNLSCVSTSFRRAVSIADRKHEDWKLYQSFIAEHLPHFIKEIKDGRIKQELTECYEKLSQLDGVECTFLEKEAQFFRELLLPFPRAFRCGIGFDSCKEYLTAHPEVNELLEMTDSYLLGNSGTRFAKWVFKKWAKENNFALPKAIFKRCLNPYYFVQEFMEALAEEGDMKNAQALFTSVSPHMSIHIATISAGYIKQNQIEEGVSFARNLATMEEEVIHVESAISKITDLLITNNHLDQALEVSKISQDNRVRWPSMRNVCVAFILQGRMIPETEINEITKTEESITILFLKLAKKNLLDKAIEIITKCFPDKQRRADFLRTVLRSYSLEREIYDKIASYIRNL